MGISTSAVQRRLGYATFNDLKGLDKRVQEAGETARIVGTERIHLAPAEPVQAAPKAERGGEVGPQIRLITQMALIL